MREANFIADLKAIYQDWSTNRNRTTVGRERDACVTGIESLVAELERFSAAMMANGHGAARSVRKLMDIAIKEAQPPPALDMKQREMLPELAAWEQTGHLVHEIERILERASQAGAGFGDAARFLHSGVAAQPRPIEFLETAIANCRSLLVESSVVMQSAVVERGSPWPFNTVLEQAHLATDLQTLAVRQKLHLLDTRHPEATRLIEELAHLTRLERALDRAAEPNKAWTPKLTAAETCVALAIARQREASFWSFLSAQWRAVKRQVRSRYRAEVVSLTGVLERLAEEHDALAKVEEQSEIVRIRFGLDDIGTARVLDRHWNNQGTLDLAQRKLLDACRSRPDELAGNVIQLADGRVRLDHLATTLAGLFQSYKQMTPAEIEEKLGALDDARDIAPEIATLIAGLENKSAALAGAWRSPLSARELFLSVLHHSIARSLKRDRNVERLDSAALLDVSERLAKELSTLRRLNATCLLENSERRFRARRGQADAYAEGQQFLEHQFALQRPSAAMRDFLTGARAEVVRDLKPIWMMSPLSVADTLPLVDDLFDVVVFDEASQIPLEDALPTLYRARQCIIVGDEMQLPPTSFFAARSEDDEHEVPDYLAFGMTADSHASLSSTRLDWHYRSRHEALIGFCNQAFYFGRLKTIPSRTPLAALGEIRTEVADNLARTASRVISRPISFHKVGNAVFKDQQNRAEALYIAKLVQALLAQGDRKSIGIVAFSQPQQSAIEEALESLAADNATFRRRLETERDREDDGQFVGLFVKNLENVQGARRPYRARPASPASHNSSLTKVFERNLKAIIIELLVFGLELIAATGAAMEELCDSRDRRMRWRVHPCRASDICQTIEIVVDDILEELADLYSSYWLIANSQHLRPRTLRGNVLVAPSHFVVEAQACNGLAACVEPHVLRARDVSLEMLRIRHFGRGQQVDHGPYLFTLGSVHWSQSKST